MRDTPLAKSSTHYGLLTGVPITKESTVSRVVVNNDLLRVVYFAFDAGEMLTDHSSPRAVVVTVLAGETDFTVGEEVSRLGPGDLVYLAPGQRHALTAVTPCQLSLVMVDTAR